MAETIASAVVGAVFEKLTDEAFKKFARSQNIHSELDELQTTLSQINALLNDASHKETTQETVGLWLNSLQHLAYDIDDLLDDVATQAMHRELTQQSGAVTTKVRNLIVPTCCTNLSLDNRLRHKLSIITKKLQILEKQKGDLGLVEKAEKKKNMNRGNESSLLESDVVGREGEIEKLINSLLLGGHESCHENFSIVPIVGMGGVGKTTMARLLYNDTKVKAHFELKAWVCVSDDFDTFKISDTILRSLTRENKELKDLNQVQTALTQEFKDKRFLLVVDDVWSESYDDWEILVRPFRSCAPGSRIIMTTRKEQLLKTLGFHHLDHLESLSDTDALSLFALHALGVNHFDSHLTLRPKGEAIVEKCGCLPLALKAIGRLLRTKTNEEEWDDVLNSKIWDLEDCNKIVPALRLSYHDLSARLKQLFAYCSLFPKDYLFGKEELILLWMAQGYLNQLSTNKSPEHLGEEYFEKLLSRSFFQYAPNDKSLFVMHDLMNELATYVAGEYFLRFEKQTKMEEEALVSYRHMSFFREEFVGYQKFKAFERAKSLRTLVVVPIGVESWGPFYLSSKILLHVLPELLLLRVLSLSRFKINEVPEFIGSLKHLRYLSLSQTDIEELPENVGNLYNLETLIIFGCERLIKLPKSFLKLKKLRHLDIRDTPCLKKLPLGIGKLRSLHTLTKIIIGGEVGFAITELKGLPNLHGEISIEGLGNVESATHAREANLSLKKLTKLEMKWGDDSQRGGTFEKEIFNELKPHNNTLKSFGIKYYPGIEFPSWVGDPSFYQLVHVSMGKCKQCISLPPLGQLPSLKELYIQGMDEVKVIGSEFNGSTNVVAFPSLEILTFIDMSGWEEWLVNSGVLDAVFPSLREIHIKGCPKLRNVSVDVLLPSLKILELSGCGDNVLRNLVRPASSITKLKINSISGLTDEVWRGAIKYLGAVEEVDIGNCSEIKYLWESEAEASMVLVNLKTLSVGYCENLISLGEKEEKEDFGGNLLLSSLRGLSVDSCKSMERVWCPNNNGIESLSIGFCDSVTDVSFPTTKGGGEGGKNLKSFKIEDCRELTEKINNATMPMVEGVYIFNWINLKSITQLSNFIHTTRLNIWKCPSIESLSNLELSNLTYLYISDCERLESLPELSNLTFLKELKITFCPSMNDSFPMCGGGLASESE